MEVVSGDGLLLQWEGLGSGIVVYDRCQSERDLLLRRCQFGGFLGGGADLLQTDKVSKLKMVDFEGPFVTHGLDIYYSASSPNTVYIYAINHLPNPAWPGDLLDLPPALHPADPTPPKARSRVEIFKHEIGSGVATHLRSVWHAELRTPNDILAISEKEFYVTNDHYYREGFMRKMEDMNMPYTNKKTTTVFVTVDSLTVGDKKDDTTGVTAVVAIAGIHNNNGLGRGADDGEIIIGRAAAGVVTRLRKAVSHGHKLEVVDEIQLDSCIDNPFYFNDPYAKQTGRDASGYVLAGLGKAVKFPDPNEVDPVMIWLVRPTTPRTRSSGKIQAARRVGKELKKREGEEEGDGDGFVRRLIFQDNGKLIATASIGVLVAIDPEVNGGKKQAKLFLSGPFSKNAVVTIIDL